MTKVITWESNFVIYNHFTCDVNISLWRHYLEWQCDVKNFHEMLRYLFQILATPLNRLRILFTDFWTLNESKTVTCNCRFCKQHSPLSFIISYYTLFLILNISFQFRYFQNLSLFRLFLFLFLWLRFSNAYIEWVIRKDKTCTIIFVRYSNDSRDCGCHYI